MTLIDAAVIAAGVAAGAVLGRRLARRGITADNALTGRQGPAYGILIGIAGSFAALYFSEKLSYLAWLPTIVLLYGESAVWPMVTVLASAGLGLLVVLEWPGRREAKRLRLMVAGCAVLLLAEGYLAWRTLPVTGILLAPSVTDGVVMQTTSYTCAPATIATLVRAAALDTTMTERRAVEIARTSREGTSTIAELRTMRQLGLSPRFARRLTAESLVAAGRMALLHVDEPVGVATVRHAVALLAVDPARRTVTIGNPLRGRHVMGFDELRGYWIGEAIFVNRGGAELR